MRTSNQVQVFGIKELLFLNYSVFFHYPTHPSPWRPLISRPSASLNMLKLVLEKCYLRSIVSKKVHLSCKSFFKKCRKTYEFSRDKKKEEEEECFIDSQDNTGLTYREIKTCCQNENRTPEGEMAEGQKCLRCCRGKRGNQRKVGFSNVQRKWVLWTKK